MSEAILWGKGETIILKEEIKKILPIFETYPKVKLVYLFGSRAKGKIGPLSDFDLAIFVDEPDKQKRFDLRVKIMDEVTRKLQTNRVDVCLLNDIQSSELKYNIIKEGELIFQREPFKVLIEPRILNQYFDFHQSLLRYGLTSL